MPSSKVATSGVFGYINGIKGDAGSQGSQGNKGDTGSAGPAGSIAASLRGAWTGGTAYALNDIVTNNGNTYVCVTAHTSGATSISTTNFKVIAVGGGGVGPHQLFRAGYWYQCGIPGSTNWTLPNNILRAVPFYVTTPTITVGRMCLELTTAGVGTGPVLRFGLYADDGTGFPGALMVDGGTVSATSANKRQLTITSTAASSGTVWAAVAAQGCDTTAPLYRSLGVNYGVGVDDSTFLGGGTNNDASFCGVEYNGTVSGALPSTFNVTGSFGTQPLWPRMWIKCV